MSDGYLAKIGRRSLALAACAAFLAACAKEVPKHLEPLSYHVQRDLLLLGLKAESPIMLRIFKEDSELEVWKQNGSGQYALFRTYPICKWSGEFGPKLEEGDKQAPEGFYTIKPGQMNPWSNYYLSFNLGYPNRYDQSYDRTGAYLMVRGACSSAGCYSMTDEYIADIFALAREAFDGGQEAFQVQAYPFRMTEENMARFADNPWYPFWQNLKEGYDAFERDKVPPKVTVCGQRYLFNMAFDIPDENKIDPKRPCPAGEQILPPGLSVAASPVLNPLISGSDIAGQ